MKDFSLVTVGLLSVSIITATAGGANPAVTPSDPKITPQALALYCNLSALAGKKILFGHQDSTLYGVGWCSDSDPLRSDVRSACGKLPAVYGWDFSEWDKYQTEDGKSLMAVRIREAFERGGINTMSWHMWNPVTGKNFYDNTPAVYAILPGGDKHEKYKADLDRFAASISSLKDKNGTPIPIIFRPFHEHTADWAWWGKGHCTPDEYAKLWRFTVDYLRNQKGLHQLLYAYSPSRIKNGQQDDYLYGYPGDGYVDIFGCDQYCQDTTEVLPELRVAVKLARNRGKVAALTETGVAKGLVNAKPGKYFTERLLKPLKEDPSVRGAAYLLLWRDGGPDHFWIPGEGSPFLGDFKAFASDPMMGFEGEFGNIYK
jgi:mannan endo-1,4-beta-mannosidase